MTTRTRHGWSVLAAALTLGMAGAAGAGEQSWIEVVDAGDFPAHSAQLVAGGGSLASISGALDAGAGDVCDAFWIVVLDPESFVASTDPQSLTGAAALFDSRLFLFDVQGRPALFNDDSSGADGQSTLTGMTTHGPTSVLAGAGVYALVIAGGGTVPADGTGRSLFVGVDRDSVTGADPAAGPFSRWMSSEGGKGGSYTIALQGVAGVALEDRSLVNPSFETNYLGWTIIGATAIVSLPDFLCTDGAQCSFQSTCNPAEGGGTSCGPPAEGAVPDAQLESFCGLPPGSLDALAAAHASGQPAIEGSAIRQDFSTTATNVLVEFDYNLLTDEFDVLPQNDLVFLGLNGVASWLDDVESAELDLSPTFFFSETGYKWGAACVYEPSSVELCLGVVDVGDDMRPSAVVSDDFRLGSGGGGGCPGFTHAHDDPRPDHSLTTYEDVPLDIPWSVFLANDSDPSLPVVDVLNAVCGVTPADVTNNVAEQSVTLTPPEDFPSMQYIFCSFDYVIEGPTSPFDPTLVLSTANVFDIRVMQGTPEGPGLPPLADTPGFSVGTMQLDTVEDVPVPLGITIWSEDDDDSEHVELIVYLSEGSLNSGFCEPCGDVSGYSEWRVVEEEVPDLAYIPVPNRANTESNGTCGSGDFPCSTGDDIFIEFEVSAFEDGYYHISQVTVPHPPFAFESVIVREAADAPMVDVPTPVTGVEDAGSVPLPLTAALVDTDGSEVLSLVLSGVPTEGSPGGVTLSAGTYAGANTWSLSEENLDGLALVIGDPAWDDLDANIDLVLTATATEIESALPPLPSREVAATAVSFEVQINAVADPPSLTITSPVFTEVDVPVALDIQATLVDTDGSETLEVEISDVPLAAWLSAGIQVEPGVWLLDPPELDDLVLTPAPNSPFDLMLTVTARTTELVGQCGTSPGGGGSECEEDLDCSGGTCVFSGATTAGSLLVDLAEPQPFFADGFESGDTSGWE